MTPAELNDLPVTFSLETAARAIGVGRNQAYRLLHEGRFPVRVLTICGRHKVSRFDLLRYLGADLEMRSPDVPPVGETAGQNGASGHADRSPLRPVRGGARP